MTLFEYALCNGINVFFFSDYWKELKSNEVYNVKNITIDIGLQTQKEYDYNEATYLYFENNSPFSETTKDVLIRFNEYNGYNPNFAVYSGCSFKYSRSYSFSINNGNVISRMSCQSRLTESYVSYCIFINFCIHSIYILLNKCNMHLELIRTNLKSFIDVKITNYYFEFVNV